VRQDVLQGCRALCRRRIALRDLDRLASAVRMRLLVLGGTAWLGRCIAAAAVERGHQVTCLARGESGAVPPGAAFTHGDRDGLSAYREVAR